MEEDKERKNKREENLSLLTSVVNPMFSGYVTCKSAMSHFPQEDPCVVHLPFFPCWLLGNHSAA